MPPTPPRLWCGPRNCWPGAGRSPRPRHRRAGSSEMDTVLRSHSRELAIGPGHPFCIIGERINPTGRKLFQQQLRRGDLSRLEIDVADQIAGGAMVLDINMGAPLADETEPLKYPSIFLKSDLLVLSKIDLLPYVPFDIEAAAENARKVHPGMEIVKVSCLTGNGLHEWMMWLEERRKARKPLAQETTQETMS